MNPKNNMCLKTIKHKFLWFKWESKITEHDWAYSVGKDIRECERCGRREVFFQTEYFNNGSSFEDWRKIIK